MNNTRQPSASHKMNFNKHFSQHSFTANFSNCRPKFNVWNGISRVKKITYNFHDESIRLLVALHEVISFFSILVRRISKISISLRRKKKRKREEDILRFSGATRSLFHLRKLARVSRRAHLTGNVINIRPPMHGGPVSPDETKFDKVGEPRPCIRGRKTWPIVA